MRLGIIAPWYERHERTPLLLERVLHESTRPPDALWIIGETDADRDAALAAYRPNGRTSVQFHVLHTPRRGDRYAVIPHAHKINWALDRIDADAIGYLDNLSMPRQDKYARMMAALEEHDDWGAVYCPQDSRGAMAGLGYAVEPIADAYCVLNYTQVIHRATPRRWPLDMGLANLGEAILWRELHHDWGPFYPVGGLDHLDEHEFVRVDWHK